MSRLTTTNNYNEVIKPSISYAVLVDFNFDSGHVRLNSSDRDLSFGGNTYSGFFGLGSISSFNENGALTPENIDFQLWCSSSLMATTLSENYHGRGVTVYIGYLDESMQFVDTPWIAWEGKMDVMSITTDENKIGIKLTCENRLLLWNNSSGWLYTQEHQNVLTSSMSPPAGGDTFFDQLGDLMNKSVKWLDTTVKTFYGRDV